jgi:hypothetical protein
MGDLMKKIFQFLILTFFTALTTGCDPFEGTLDVKKIFTVVDNFDSKFEIPAGSQAAKLDFLSRDRVRIKLKINGTDKKITMSLPKNLNLPENGNFSIQASELNQNFSIQGSIDTQRSDSGAFRGYEQCQYQRRETVCTVVNNQYVCHDEYRTAYGQQRVEYFTRNTEQKINVQFNSDVTLAVFNGNKSQTEKIYTFKDYCF